MLLPPPPEPQSEPQINEFDEDEYPEFLLSPDEINTIFRNDKIDVETGNRILSVLQARRLEGTLDLALPGDIAPVTTEEVFNSGLDWLRRNHPVDEDAAILHRIEREEEEERQRLIERATKVGLYKPQSGAYEQEVDESGDPRGKSILDEIRKRNEEKAKLEEDEERREWLLGEAKDRELLEKQQKQLMQKDLGLQTLGDNSAALTEARPRADPDERPALAWIQKHHLRATNNEIDTSKLSTARRILPSLCVVLATTGLCYLFAHYYDQPEARNRLWPKTPMSAATVTGLIGANFLVFALWRVCPPAWRMLNRYFISVPLYPYSMSVVGSMFSHQLFTHLAMNMLILWVIGNRLHQEVGRGDFLGLYVASGAVSTFTSLAALVLQNKLTVTSLGASGAIAGLLAAWCILHSEYVASSFPTHPSDPLTLAFIPKSWEQYIQASGSTFLAGLVLIEITSMVLPMPVKYIARMDHWAHLGGYAVGAGVGSVWKERKDREKRDSVWGKFLSV
ncbi:hypothetical protein KEM55_002621 [Ascosphaera atra]|nr:hypothetical protein KEM55_002621 [Ascosphaera atra]